MQIVVLPARDIVILVAGLAGEIGRASIGADIDAIILKNGLNIVTNGFGFIAQAVIMAFILFR